MSAKKARIRAALLLTLLVAAASAVAAVPEDRLESFTYRFDFESGSVGAWSSYPPAQDTAYDPTIWIKKVPGNPGLALVREVKPNYPIDYVFGFRKKLNLLVDAESRIWFRFFVKNFGRTEGVIVKLALGDGTAKETRVPAGENGAWHSADISLREFAPAKTPLRLEAVAFLAVCSKADPEAKLAFAVDDVEVTGRRPKLAAIREPLAHWLEEFSAFVAGRHYAEGESIAFEGDLPFAAPGAFVHLVSALPEGNAFDIRLEPKARAFRALVRGDRLKPGLWRADFFAGSGRADGSPTTLYFLVGSGRATAGHPRFFLSAQEKSRCLELIGRPGRARDAWESVREAAKSYRAKYNPADFNYNLDAYDEVFWLPTYVGYANSLRTISGFARSNAFVYALGGDREAGLAARQALLKTAAWPTFVHPHILNQGQFTYWPVGLVLIDLAVAYDLVYDLLSPAERQSVAAALYHKGVTEVFREYVRDNRVSSDTSNWISHVTGGGILSAVAVGGEIKDEDLEPCLTGMILKLARLVRATFDRDGDYGEGYGYHNFTMQTLAEIMPVLAARYGMALPEKVFRSHAYLAYQLNPATGAIHDFGDTGAKLLPMSNFAYILRESKDPVLAWLDGLAPGKAEADLEFAAPDVRPETPEGRLSPVKLFRDVGTAIFRSGFGPKDFSFVFRAGPFFNHQHFDQGSFFLSDRGQDFLVEGGRTDYYDDPWYQAFFIQPGAHNCLLVDENVESQRAGDLLDDVPDWHDFAKITDFLDFPEGAFLSAELAPIYKGKFQTLRRTVLYLKPRTIVLIDSGAGGREVSRLDLRFHAPFKEDIRLDGDAASVRRENQELALRTLYPARHGAAVLKRPLSLDEFKSENPLTMKARGFLQLTSEVRDGSVQVVNIMSTDGALVAGAALADRENHLELKVGGRSYLIRRLAGQDLVEESGMSADLFCSGAGGSFWALRAVKAVDGGRVVLQADSPVSLALDTRPGVTTLAVWAERETVLSVACRKRPQGVERNGARTQGWTWAAGWLTLRVPGGASTTSLID